MSSGEFTLAEALNDLTQIHVGTQLTVQSDMVTDTFSYLYVVRGDSELLEKDQEKCAYYTSHATEGKPIDAAEAAKWHAKYQTDSTKMNQEMGNENATINTELMMVHTQAENLTPIYSVFEYVALIFLTTSGLINR